MRFQTPQFIDVEDKIFGPLTFKQFAYLIGGGGLIFILHRFLPFFIAILIMIPVAALSIALAFYKVNNKPFIFTLEAAFRYIIASKLYIWKKSEREAATEALSQDPGAPSYIPKVADSKLKDISWSLGVKDSIYSEAEDSSKQ